MKVIYGNLGAKIKVSLIKRKCQECIYKNFLVMKMDGFKKQSIIRREFQSVPRLIGKSNQRPAALKV